MIEKLELDSFKCFASFSSEPKPFTLLSGVNGTGKSSLIQALLVLLQSRDQPQRLMLNGTWTKLGTAKDVLYSGAQQDKITIRINGAESTYLYGSQDSQDLEAVTSHASAQLPEHWQYLSCERIGPRAHSETSTQSVRQRRQLGPLGEYTADFLATFGSEAIRKEETLGHPSAASNELGSQVEAWMGEISHGVRLRFVRHPALDVVQGSIGFADTGSVPTLHRPTNAGFGLSYSLPIFVAGLSLQEGGLLIVENPEAHLHPRGQASIAGFLAKVAKSGVQVIVETHSDHVLNALRIAVKDNVLTPEQVEVLFFEKSMKDGRAIHTARRPQIDKNGRFGDWPSGFFDEWDAALDKLV